MKNNKSSYLDIDFNEYDDRTLYVHMACNAVSIEEKEYILNNFSQRIDRMSLLHLSNMLTGVNREFCEKFPTFIKTKVSSLFVSQVEDLFYKRAELNIVSEISSYLIEQKWFYEKRESDFKLFYIAYELCELLKDLTNLKNDKEIQEKIIEIGNTIIQALPIGGLHSLSLLNMILKNYMNALNLTNSEYKETFLQNGYYMIGKFADANIRITPSMILFDCYFIKDLYKLNSPQLFNFYDEEEDRRTAYYQFGNIEINLAGVRCIYDAYLNGLVSLQFLFFVMSHELRHAFTNEIFINLDQKTYDEKTELQMYYVTIANAVKYKKGLDFYIANHGNIYFEYDANVFGIQALYERYKYIPQIKESDKLEINRILARSLYYYGYNVNQCKTYICPIDFTKKYFDEIYDEIKDELDSDEISIILGGTIHLSERLKELEDNLDDYEKLVFGYDSPCVDILKKIADGKVKTTNLFEYIQKEFNERQKQKTLN
ncbi:MAG: hypothetical protein J1F35_02145 [Erysipelotrichales bacterium]|nr:hypothetical protein [Erysipelotrichales bacterium]